MISFIDGNFKYSFMLKRLFLSHNQIKTIDFNIDLPNLLKIDLNFNQFEYLPTKLFNLEVLEIASNKLKNIDSLKYLAKLQYLNMGSNQIEDIDVLKNLKNLTNLYLENNTIKNGDPLTDLTKLTWLNLNQNRLKDICWMMNLTNLWQLFIFSNSLINLSCNSSLIFEINSKNYKSLLLLL